MNLSRVEQETIVLFNEAEKFCSVYTYNGKLKRRLRELYAEYPEEVKLTATDGSSETYEAPKSWIRINPLRKVKPLSNEEKEKLVVRLQANRQSVL